MEMIKAIDEFTDSLNCTDSYVLLAKHMKELIESDSRNVCASFLILRFCQSYVYIYQDQAVSSEFAESAKLILNNYLKKIKESYLENNGVVSLTVLDEISKSYVLDNKVF